MSAFEIATKPEQLYKWAEWTEGLAERFEDATWAHRWDSSDNVELFAELEQFLAKCKLRIVSDRELENFRSLAEDAENEINGFDSVRSSDMRDALDRLHAIQGNAKACLERGGES